MDSDLKAQADALFSELGMNLTTAFNIFVRQSIREGGIPFEISINQPKQRCTRGYKRYKETSGLIEWKECQIFHSIFT